MPTACFVPGQGPLGATHVRPGDYVRVSYKGRSIYAIFVDVGPKNQVGEVSMYVAKALGLSDDPRKGGLDAKHVIYEVLPGSGPAVPAKPPAPTKRRSSR